MKFLSSIKNWLLGMFEPNEKTSGSKSKKVQNVSDENSHEYRIG